MPSIRFRYFLIVVAWIAISTFTATAAPNLLHRYSFTVDASDSAGLAHGTLVGGATVAAGQVVLDGNGSYVDLPNGIFMGLNSVAIELWLTENNSGNWARIFDFGNSSAGEDLPASGTQYLFLTPQSGSGTLRGGITTTGSGGGEQWAEWPGMRLPAGVRKHVVWVADGFLQTARLYVDGALVGQNPALTLRPSDLGDTLNNWIGRSQFSPDAWLRASIDEVRIHDGPLSGAEVAESFALGPELSAFAGPVGIALQPQSRQVMELSPVTFQAAYYGSRPIFPQWFRNNVAIPGATNSTLTLASAALNDQGAVYRLMVSNVVNSMAYTATSSGAVLSVTQDDTRPVLLRAGSLFPNEVLVLFSEGVHSDGALSTGNYSITHAAGSLPVTAARYGSTPAQVILTTAAQALSTNYTLNVSGVRDLAAAGNLLVPNSQAGFIATPFLGVEVGNPSVASSLTPVPGGCDLSGSGTGISGTTDQFVFGQQTRTNDFDLKVRVAALTFASAWTRAGLMARDGLATNAPFAASFATPGVAGCHFASRPTAGTAATMAGSFPINTPHTWLRLRRSGNSFQGFASLDGTTWQLLGSASITMPAVLNVGFALTAGTAAGSTSAQFRDFGDAGGPVIAGAPLPFEPPGPCSRRTPLVISEIMYHPPALWAGTNDLEFVELWNSGLATEDLTGHRFTGEISFAFPTGTTIAPGQFLVVAKDPAAAQAFYGVACLGPYDNKLANNGGALRLRNELDGVLLEIEYDTKAPWPVAPDGAGHSLVLKRPSYGENSHSAWSASDVIRGSPGSHDGFGLEPARSVVINEFLAHTDDPQLDYVELFNTSTQPVDLSGAWLSDQAGENLYRILDGTTIGQRTSLAFNQVQLGFSLSADGEKIFLVNSNRTRVLDAVSFDGQENGVSTGRAPDGAPGFQPLATVTQGTPNSAPRARSIVINEIMYHPISQADDDEFVELHNRSGFAINLAQWKLQGGLNFSFPTNALIAAGGHLVVARNLTNLLSRYPQLNATNAFGNFSGSLRNSGERLALARPDELVGADAQGRPVTNIFFIAVDHVTYGDGGRWGKWSDGGGSSLELTDPDADGRLPANWADSDESAKAAWTTINVTNVMENGQNPATVNEGNSSLGVANRFEAFLQGAGESLLDSVEFRSNGGANLLSNGTFDSGTAPWTLGGVLRSSFGHPAAGIGGSQALHLVASDRGDTGPNKVASPLSATAATAGTNTGTIRASARWLKGSPWLLLRVRGNWMEVSQRLNVPLNCGTPGLPNSRRVANAGPAISHVAHAPALPNSAQEVVVTARASDPDGIGTIALSYRIDPEPAYSTIAMLDNGAAGDAVAGDGLYSATIPGQPSGALVAFTVYATDAAAAAAQFPAEAPARECLIRWGELIVPGTIGTYRLWVTSPNIAFWATREKNANDPIDATFVYGDSRVIYNVNTLYSGSPFHVPNYNGPMGTMACDYEVNFPPDDRFLGSEPFVLTAYDVVSGNFFFNDDSAQVDLTGNWIARKLGQPFNYRRHVHVFINGLRRGTIYDDAQQPNSEMLAEFFPNDDDGQLRKIESWFEFADDALSQGSTYTTLTRVNKSTGDIDSKRYRWNWRPRATENPDQWSALTNLIAVVNDTNSPNYEARVRTWMDVPNFLRPVITHHVCSSWDSYAYQRGKNMYAYKPDRAGWRLLMWDIELALGAGGNSATDSIYNMFDKTLLRLINNYPEFHREYLRGFQEAVDTALLPGAADPVLDERYASFQQNAVPLVSPQFIKNFIASRRNYLLSVLPTAAFAVNNGPYTVVSGNNILTLTGSAPLSVADILINGNAYPVTWIAPTTWRMLVPLTGGTNLLSITAVDRNGDVIANASGSLIANYTGNTAPPEGSIVFNEIMPFPGGAHFVEFFNSHSNFTFDLSAWRVNGLDYTFPAGATLPPSSYLVLAGDVRAYSQAYGLTNVAFDQFSGRLDEDGETLTLLRPAGGFNFSVVDRVRYETAPPWPAPANGSSLQLVDALQDNSRVANWAVQVPTNLPSATPQWVYVTHTAPLPGSASRIYLYLGSAGELYLDDFVLVSGSVPGSGPNLLNNAGFESPLSGTWSASADFAGSTLSTTVKHSGNSSLRMVATAPGSGSSDSVYQVLASSLPSGGTYTLSFWYLQNSAGKPFIARLQNSTAAAGLYVSVDPVLPATTRLIAGATPGSQNNVVSNLPPFPALWLNEAQAVNASGPADNFGQRDPWLELYNGGPTPLSLAGYYLSDNYTNLAQWPLPSNSSLSPTNWALIWCDNQTNQNAPAFLHAPFPLSPGGGRLALSRTTGNSMQLVDYLNYPPLGANWSYGDLPDGQPFYRDAMSFATPGATNNGASAPLTVFINEWMADNTSWLADPADGGFEDWFELYNPGTNAVDLGGCFLTDNLTNKFQFEIPNNGRYVIPPHGYLLVWADNEPGQNSTNVVDLHASFALSRGGEAIGLFAPNGTAIDAVTFGAQALNISEGRFPNGAPSVYAMPTPTPRAANVLPNTAPAVGVKVTATGVELSWSSAPGQWYQVEYKDSLTDPEWTSLGDPLPGDSSILAFTYPVDQSPQRFFRVALIGTPSPASSD